MSYKINFNGTEYAFSNLDQNTIKTYESEYILTPSTGYRIQYNGKEYSLLSRSEEYQVIYDTNLIQLGKTIDLSYFLLKGRFNNYSGYTLNLINTKLSTTIFNTYTADTATRILGIEYLMVTGATNGLTKTGQKIKLGGSLTGTTVINAGGLNSLYFGGQFNSAERLGEMYVASKVGGHIEMSVGENASRFVLGSNSFGLTTSVGYYSGIESSIGGGLQTYHSNTQHTLKSTGLQVFAGSNQLYLNDDTSGSVTNGRGFFVELNGSTTANDIVLRNGYTGANTTTSNIKLQNRTRGSIILEQTNPDELGSINIFSNAGSLDITSNGVGNPTSIALLHEANLGSLTLGSTVGYASYLKLAYSAVTFTDSRAIKKGIQYSGNYSTDFTSRSLIDKGYLTGITSTLLAKSVFNAYTGATKLIAGSNITLTPSISGITISSSGGGGSGTITGATNIGGNTNGLYTSVVSGSIRLKSLAAGSNITLTPSSTGITITTNGLASILSPTFTGTPLITSTPSANDNSHKIADTAYVDAQVIAANDFIFAQATIASFRN